MIKFSGVRYRENPNVMRFMKAFFQNIDSFVVHCTFLKCPGKRIYEIPFYFQIFSKLLSFAKQGSLQSDRSLPASGVGVERFRGLGSLAITNRIGFHEN